MGGSRQWAVGSGQERVGQLASDYRLLATEFWLLTSEFSLLPHAYRKLIVNSSESGTGLPDLSFSGSNHHSYIASRQG